MATASGSGDHTLNKIALYSALFAGVAYVGYSCVKDAFSRGSSSKSKEDALLEYESHRRRIFLRRLSGSEASSFLLGNGSSNDQKSRLVLRPLSVQGRIQELNLRARHFAETVMAVHLHDAVPEQPQGRSALNAHGMSFSLQTSPTHSPRCMDPIDFTNLASSRYSSKEDLSFSSLPPFESNGNGLASKWRSSRRSLSGSREEMYESMEAQSERLLDEREAELRKRLQNFEEGNTKILTLYEAKSLVALLHAKDCSTLQRALVTISSCAAFTQNQDSLREAGCVMRFQHLVIHSDRSVKLAALQALANMALNTTNQREMEHIVPLIVSQFEGDEIVEFDEDLTHQLLVTLTNIAALTDWHHHYIASLPNLFDLIESSSTKVCMQALRLLINLSTNEHMIQYLHSANATAYLWKLLDANQPEDKLLRVVTLLANIVCGRNPNLNLSQLSSPTLDSSHSLNSPLLAPSLHSDKQTSVEPFLNGASLLLSHPPKADIEERLNSILATVTHEDILNKTQLIYRTVI